MLAMAFNGSFIGSISIGLRARAAAISLSLRREISVLSMTALERESALRVGDEEAVDQLLAVEPGVTSLLMKRGTQLSRI